MKKGIVWLLVLAAGGIGAYFFWKGKEQREDGAAPRQQPLAISKNNERFNLPFNQLLNEYYGLRDALVEWDTAGASNAARRVTEAAGKIPFGELKGDTVLLATAQSFTDGIVAEAKAIFGENTLEGKRRSFYTLSENLYNLARTVHYDQAIIYHMRCPMAFNDQEEAFWISNNSKIVNPYLGKKHPKYVAGMLGCGDIEDSVDFRQK